MASELKHGKNVSGADSIESYTASIQADLRKIQSRNWWSWSNTVVIVLLLTCTIVSFSLPSLLRDEQPFSSMNLNLAIRGLVALVLLFNHEHIVALRVMRNGQPLADVGLPVSDRPPEDRGNLLVQGDGAVRVDPHRAFSATHNSIIRLQLPCRQRRWDQER